MTPTDLRRLAESALVASENRLAWGTLGGNPRGYRKSLAEIALNFARDHGYREADGAFTELHSLREACAREPQLARALILALDLIENHYYEDETARYHAREAFDRALGELGETQ